MPPFKSFAAARSLGIRGSSVPKTPEPSAEGECQAPPSPRLRFRLRKRQGPQVASPATGPTQQFLASVAGADVPIPSIEEPRVVDDEDMVDSSYPIIYRIGDYPHDENSQHSKFGRQFSPPRTPALEDVASLSPHEFPDWSMNSIERDLESSPEGSRPSTARSTRTESSLFSHLSFASHASSAHVSPEWEQTEQYSGLPPMVDYNRTIRPTNSHTVRSRKAIWTPALSQHLWATYMLYLQDPTVTPLRVGKSGIPPEGVCIRVARVAMRTWRGSRSIVYQAPIFRSGSETPTKESTGPVSAWPHTRAATRAHLRELCKTNRGAAERSRLYLAQTPTPMGRIARRCRARYSTPLRSPSIFSPSDMVMSLALSTSDSMQPHGPLAQLGRSQPTEALEQIPLPSIGKEPVVDQTGIFGLRAEPPIARLGSPFMAQSYGPSSSQSLAASLDAAPTADRQAQTMGGRQGLRSPLPLNRTAPNSIKRRARSARLESRRSKRPSLGQDFWEEPSSYYLEKGAPQLPPSELGRAAAGSAEGLAVPRANLQELFETTHVLAGTTRTTLSIAAAASESASRFRLGSPFAASNTSLSVPNRSSSPAGFGFGTVRRRAFATVQQPAAAPEAAKTPMRSTLASRLAYIDERLKDFRRRDHARRSQSPF